MPPTACAAAADDANKNYQLIIIISSLFIQVSL